MPCRLRLAALALLAVSPRWLLHGLSVPGVIAKVLVLNGGWISSSSGGQETESDTRSNVNGLGSEYSPNDDDDDIVVILDE